jgi:RNA polymerase sigma-70 factor (ECF subfamily)
LKRPFRGTCPYFTEGPIATWESLHDAEDAVQNAFLSAYKHLDHFKGSAKITTWLISIVTHSALTQLRRRPRQPHSPLDEDLALDQKHCVSEKLVDVMPIPEDDCIKSELQGHLMPFVRKLSPSLRKAIRLRDFDGLATSEAAGILGVPEGTIKARVSRARSRLKRHAQLGQKRITVIAKAQEFGTVRDPTN